MVSSRTMDCRLSEQLGHAGLTFLLPNAICGLQKQKLFVPLRTSRSPTSVIYTYLYPKITATCCAIQSFRFVSWGSGPRLRPRQLPSTVLPCGTCSFYSFCSNMKSFVFRSSESHTVHYCAVKCCVWMSVLLK